MTTAETPATELADDYKKTPTDRLRDILAVNRGLEFLKEFERTLSETADQGQSNRAEYLQRLFADIHRSIFTDMHVGEKSTLGLPPRNGGKRSALRQHIIALAEQLFDSNGFVRGLDREVDNQNYQSAFRDKLAGALAKFYAEMNKTKPFEYGNELTLNLFIDCVSKLLERKGSSFVRVDFRRLNATDMEMLGHSQDTEQLKDIFTRALDTSRTPVLMNQSDEFGKLGNGRVMIDGIPFLGYNDPKTGVDYLVTVNGGLIKREAIQEELDAYIRQSGNQIMQYRVKPEKMINDQVAEIYNKPIVDGYEIKDGMAPLICLDVNPITGLRGPSNDEIANYLKNRFGKETPLFQLNDRGFAKLAIDAADAKLKPILELAIQHIQHITQQMDRYVDGVFEHKMPAKNLGVDPVFVMSMGGAGAGKTARRGDSQQMRR